MPSRVTRRGFLQITAGAGAIASVAPAALTVADASAWPRQGPSPNSTDGWFDRPMRWAQLTLVENDPGRFDPQFWLDYFKRLHADAACLSAGGIVAYYPTEIPLHHRSAFLGTSDPFGALVRGCRALGMHVIARTDPHAARDDVRTRIPIGSPPAMMVSPRVTGRIPSCGSRARSARTTSSSWTRSIARSQRRTGSTGSS